MTLTLADFDLAKIQTAIRGQLLPEHEYLGVEHRLQTAIRTWLPSDLASYDSVLLEEEFTNEGHGFLDLVLVKGQRATVVDWKTTSGWDAPGWALKKKLDHQTSWYLTYGAEHLKVKGLDVDYLEYRCLDADGAFKAFQLAPSPLHARRCQEQHYVAQASFYAMRDVTGPWLQNMPDACFLGSKAGAATCRFYQDCTTGSEPRLVQQSSDKVLDWVPKSKSAFKMFLRCPEQYRRTRLLGDSTEDMGIEAKVGIAFHLGAAEIWRQAFQGR